MVHRPDTTKTRNNQDIKMNSDFPIDWGAINHCMGGDGLVGMWDCLTTNPH